VSLWNGNEKINAFNAFFQMAIAAAAAAIVFWLETHAI